MLPKAAQVGRVADFIRDKVDLPARHDLALLIITSDPHIEPLILTDGNHRAMAHYTMQKSIQDIPAFVCVQPKILGWNFG